MPLVRITRMFPSAPAWARMAIVGVGAVTSRRVPVRVAFSAPVAWIFRSAVNDLIDWVCCEASENAEADEVVPECEPVEDAPLYVPGLHPATATAAATAMAAKPSGRTARAGTPKRTVWEGRTRVVPSSGAPGRRAFICENTLGPPWVGDCPTCHAMWCNPPPPVVDSTAVTHRPPGLRRPRKRLLIRSPACLPGPVTWSRLFEGSACDRSETGAGGRGAGLLTARRGRQDGAAVRAARAARDRV